MSHWISLRINGEIVEVPSFSEGGTYAIGGSTEADLNVTYNYAPFFWEHLGEGGLKSLDGKLAKDTIEVIEKAVQALGTERDNDYWKATAGNAGFALNILLSWAKLFPDGEWHVN